MSTYSLEDEEFDSTLIDAENVTLRPDPGEIAPSAVGSPVDEMQVLVTLAVNEGSYEELQTGWGSCQETLPCI